LQLNTGFLRESERPKQFGHILICQILTNNVFGKSESGGIENLFDKSRRQPNLKNRVDEPTEQAVLAHALDFPAHGQLRVSNELRKAGIFVSSSGVRSIWLRHGLASFKDRLKALEGKRLAIPPVKNIRPAASCDFLIRRSHGHHIEMVSAY